MINYKWYFTCPWTSVADTLPSLDKSSLKLPSLCSNFLLSVESDLVMNNQNTYNTTITVTISSISQHYWLNCSIFPLLCMILCLFLCVLLKIRMKLRSCLRNWRKSEEKETKNCVVCVLVVLHELWPYLCPKYQNQQLSSQITNESPVSSGGRQVHQRCGIHLTLRCNFNVEVVHIAGSVNTTADFFPRLEVKVTQIIRLIIREYIQTAPIEVTTSSSVVTGEEQFSSAKQTTRMRQMNRPLSGQKFGNTQEIGYMRVHPQWVLASESWQRSTETQRRIPWKETKQTHDFE